MARAKKINSTSKDLALPWQQQLAAYAKEGKRGVEKTSDIDRISIKGNKFRVDGKLYGDNNGRGFSGIVINTCYEQSYYDGEFDDNVSTIPACFAISYVGTDMQPDSNSVKKQASNCAECELSKWDGDTPPECKERRRLAVVIEDESGDTVVKVLSLSSTSLGNWKKYIKELSSMNLEPLQAATYIHFDEESSKAFQPVCFDFVSELKSEKQLEHLVSLLPRAEKLLEQTYDPSFYKEITKSSSAKGKKKTAKKKTSARKSKFSK